MSTNRRVMEIMMEQRATDNSFKEKPFWGFLPTYSQADMRETWFQGIEYGLEMGLNLASLEGQRITINNNMKNPRHKEFYEKFLKLAQEYKCAIQYHPQVGMCVIDRNYNYFDEDEQA